MAQPIRKRWYEMGDPFADLATDQSHEIGVQREAIPIVFVPGIMGTRLKRVETRKVVWDPPNCFLSKLGAALFWGSMSPTARHRRLIGDDFSSDYLSVDQGDRDTLIRLGVPEEIAEQALARGWGQVYWDIYGAFLLHLQNQDWTPLDRAFTFPLYAVGYNWTASNRDSGKALQGRIRGIVKENNSNETFCERAILITHSMGGFVARAALALGKDAHSASHSVLGVIHGVQPVTGSPTTYKRMKAGFEGITALVLGWDGQDVSAVLASAPGGLELLPTKDYRTLDDSPQWLELRSKGQLLRSFPMADPYEEIYLEQNQFYRLVNPDYINPDVTGAPTQPKAWECYKRHLRTARKFHELLGLTSHKNTYVFYGVGTKRAAWERVEWQLTRDTFLNINNRIDEPMLEAIRCGTALPFKSSNDEGKEKFRVQGSSDTLKAKLQDANGSGDGTVPEASGQALVTAPQASLRAARRIEGIEHGEESYADDRSRQFVVAAIQQLAKEWFDARLANQQAGK